MGEPLRRANMRHVCDIPRGAKVYVWDDEIWIIERDFQPHRIEYPSMSADSFEKLTKE